MRKIILFDSEAVHLNLLPLSFTRPVCDFRVGITTIRRKWEELLPGDYGCRPVEYLRERFERGSESYGDPDAVWVAGCVIPDAALIAALPLLEPGEAWTDGDEPMVYRGALEQLEDRSYRVRECPVPLRRLRYVFDVFLLNPELICEDYARITEGRESMPLDESNRVIGPMTDSVGRPLIFIEEGASAEGALFNTKEGPIYIGRDAIVMEGAIVRGPIAFCEHAQARMGVKLYSGSTFGPYCKVGGELSNVVMFGYSNKSHEGYLGNAVIGEWCNLGAGVSASNLKNDYSKIRIWNYATHSFMKTDLQFCGLIMGDHSKAGVNCMFNTATVVGVGVNIHGAGFPRVFLPSFSEGSPVAGFKSVPVSKFEVIARRVMARRGLELSESDRMIFEKIYEIASRYKS